jgi:hypothetical protein
LCGGGRIAAFGDIEQGQALRLAHFADAAEHDFSPNQIGFFSVLQHNGFGKGFFLIRGDDI